MRLLLQRVSRAAVRVGDETVAAIGPGLLVLVGVGRHDDRDVVDAMARAPPSSGCSPTTRAGRTGRSSRPAARRCREPVHALGGHAPRPAAGVLRRGARAARDELYERYAAALRYEGVGDVRLGRFGAVMAVELVNDGPFTIWLERRRRSERQPGTRREPGFGGRSARGQRADFVWVRRQRVQTRTFVATPSLDERSGCRFGW